MELQQGRGLFFVLFEKNIIISIIEILTTIFLFESINWIRMQIRYVQDHSEHYAIWNHTAGSCFRVGTQSKLMDELNQCRKDSSIIKEKHIYLFGRFIEYGLPKIQRDSKYPIARAPELFKKLVISAAFFSCKIICFFMWLSNTFRTIVQFLVKKVSFT